MPSIIGCYNCYKGFPHGPVVKNPPANIGDARDTGLIPGWGRPPGQGHGNPLQYSCLRNLMDRGAWWSTVHGVARVGHDLDTKLPPPKVVLKSQ